MKVIDAEFLDDDDRALRRDALVPLPRVVGAGRSHGAQSRSNATRARELASRVGEIADDAIELLSDLAGPPGLAVVRVVLEVLPDRDGPPLPR